MNPKHDFVCPECGHEERDKRYPYDEIRKGVKCPHCGNTMEILYGPVPFKLVGKDWTSGGRS